ncbi:hypothetical protein JCM18899A_50350 [Nocardioides sp. AN3]
MKEKTARHRRGMGWRVRRPWRPRRLTAVIAAVAAVCGMVTVVSVTLASTGSAAAPVINLGGRVTDPGFRGVVTSRGQQLGVARLGNGTYGVCFDTGASHPWPPGTPASSLRTNPRVGYLLSTYMGRATTDAHYAAALWWATGLDLGVNRYPSAMRDSISQMKADSASTYSAVKALHDRMLAEAAAFAAGTQGYDTNALKITYTGATTPFGRPGGWGTVTGVGVRSASGQWVPGHPIRVTLNGATFRGGTSTVWTGTTGTSPTTLTWVQTNPGAMSATMTVSGPADYRYRLHDAGNSTQRVGVSSGTITAERTTYAPAQVAYARARKIDAATGAALGGAEFTGWIDGNGDRTAQSAELPRTLTSAAADGFTPTMTVFLGAQVCFQETKAPDGYDLMTAVSCVTATGASTAASTVTVRDNLVTTSPRLSTQVNHQVASIGTTLEDTVQVSDTGGEDLTGEWRLLGPVPPVRGACAGAAWAKAPTAASGTFTATGDGAYRVGRHTVRSSGCYTYVERLQAGPSSPATDWTSPGIPTETTLVKAAPALSTQVNHQVATAGVVLVDRVQVTRTGGATVTGRWRLLGPIAARAGRCRGLSWARARVAGSGSFSVRGDGFYDVGSHRVSRAGCYTYSESLAPSASTVATGWTRPGLPAETSAVRPRGVPVPAHPTVTAGGHGPLPDPLERAGAPARVRIPRVGLSTTLTPTAFRGSELPPPANIGIGGVWSGGASLDAVAGTSVLVGHVSDDHDRPGAFKRLWGVHRGTVVMTRDHGVTTKWRVTTVTKVRKGHLRRGLFAQSMARRLVLITCTNRVTHGGYFHYTSNEVVVAVPVRR